ncbi:MAG: hypothetical protein Q9187_008594, partial [Circinaria calcarea]
QHKTDGGCSYTVPPLQQLPTARYDNFTTNDQGGPTLWIGASHNDDSHLEKITDFYILFFPDLSVFSRDSDANVTASIVALKGSISLCLKTYNTSVANGSTITGVVDTQLPTFSVQLLKEIYGYTPLNKITTTDRSGVEFYMESLTLAAFRSYLADAIFYGTYTAPNPDHPDQASEASSDTALAFGEIFYNNPPSNHITALSPLTNLETAISNVLRTTSNNHTTAPGTANYNEIYISIDFRWLYRAESGAFGRRGGGDEKKGGADLEGWLGEGTVCCGAGDESEDGVVGGQ